MAKLHFLTGRLLYTSGALLYGRVVASSINEAESLSGLPVIGIQVGRCRSLLEAGEQRDRRHAEQWARLLGDAGIRGIVVEEVGA